MSNDAPNEVAIQAAIAAPTVPEALDVFAEFATDEYAEDNGTWFPYGTARFLVARSGNRAYTKALTELVELHRNDLTQPDAAAAQKVSDEIMSQVFSTTLLLGWENVAYQKKPIPYSQENALALLRHRAFRRTIAGFADSTTAFKAKEEVEQGEA